MVVYKLEGHASNIKEKIVTQLGDALEGEENGINILLDFLETIYGEDDMAEAYDKYVEFKSKKRKKDEPIQPFISDWENVYHKCKNAKCELPDMVLCFELLQAAQLNATESQLVLTGVDYKEGKSKENLLEQMKTSLRKFKGRAIIGEGPKDSSELAIKPEETYLSKDVETFLVKKGWVKPKKRRRSNSDPVKGGGGYQGKKNMLGNNGLPLKCHSCKCQHENNCNCPCVYHFADRCPKKVDKRDESKNTDARSELGLFMTVGSSFEKTGVLEAATNDEDIENDKNDDICLVTATIEELILTTQTEDLRALIDCACPTTVTGLSWMKRMISELSEEQKEKVRINPSSRVYKFGGGERRPSKYVVQFPCNLAGKNVNIRTEVINENLPLLLGNSSLKAAEAILYISEQKASILGKEVEMKEEASGHFSLEIHAPSDNYDDGKDDAQVCFIVQNEKLSEEKIWKLHQYWGHKPAHYLHRLIKEAGKMTPEIDGFIKKINDCESCKLKDRRRPRPKVAFPRATRPNQIVTMDLKSYGTGNHSYILHLVDMFSRLHMAEFIPNKEATTIAESLLRIWISQPGLGPMDYIHSDRGGEFLNDTLIKVSEYLQVRHTDTAAYTPNANGVNERNHAVVDTMMEKMLLTDPDLKPEVALS